MSTPPLIRDPLNYDPWHLFSSVTPLDNDYERPNLAYRCGRERFWGKGCWAGPSQGGHCRGTQECTPYFNDGRWECRRPAHAGGPCRFGPKPDGQCAWQLPPCVPRLTQRAVRHRLAFLAFAAAIAIIAAFVTFGPSTLAHFDSVSPGPLSGFHNQFTGEEGCAACHESHPLPTDQWVLAAFAPSDMSSQCLDCHTFGGPPLSPHNLDPITLAKPVKDVECTTCHTEHNGETGAISGVSDVQCKSCHTKKFDGFAEDHPPFSDNFPHREQTSVKFDHAAHLARHFEEPRYADRALKACSGCHLVNDADRRVQPGSYQETCAACHDDNIPARELTLLRLPEFLEDNMDHQAVREACGPTLDRYEMMVEQMEMLTETVQEMAAGEEIDPADAEDVLAEIAPEEEEDFYSVSVDTPTLFTGLILGVDVDDVDDYGEPVQTLIAEMVEDGIDPLKERIAAISDEETANALLAGLNPELIKRVACAWAANLEYEPPADMETGGWFGDFTEIKYRAMGHADPVARNWVEFALSSVPAMAEDEDLFEVAVAFRDSIIDRKEGPGACAKCHSIIDADAVDAETDGDEVNLSVAWGFGRSQPPAYLMYSHAPHLNLLGRDLGCNTCHKIAGEADFAGAFDDFNPHRYVSNFAAIAKETCVECHAPGKVRQDCLLCHDYHYEPRFKLKMLAHDDQGNDDQHTNEAQNDQTE